RASAEMRAEPRGIRIAVAEKPGCRGGPVAGNWARQPASRRKTAMKKTLEIGGFISGAILIAFGVVVIALGASGRSTVNDSLKQEQIVGTPDMTPALIKAEAT